MRRLRRFKNTYNSIWQKCNESNEIKTKTSRLFNNFYPIAPSAICLRKVSRSSFLLLLQIDHASPWSALEHAYNIMLHIYIYYYSFPQQRTWGACSTTRICSNQLYTDQQCTHVRCAATWVYMVGAMQGHGLTHAAQGQGAIECKVVEDQIECLSLWPCAGLCNLPHYTCYNWLHATSA